MHHLLGVGVVLQLAREVLVVGGEVEVAVTAQVEQDDAFFAGLFGRTRFADGGADGVRALRRRDDALGSRELDGGLETFVWGYAWASMWPRACSSQIRGAMPW